MQEELIFRKEQAEGTLTRSRRRAVWDPKLALDVLTIYNGDIQLTQSTVESPPGLSGGRQKAARRRLSK